MIKAGVGYIDPNASANHSCSSWRRPLELIYRPTIHHVSVAIFAASKSDLDHEVCRKNALPVPNSVYGCLFFTFFDLRLYVFSVEAYVYLNLALNSRLVVHVDFHQRLLHGRDRSRIQLSSS